MKMETTSTSCFLSLEVQNVISRIQRSGVSNKEIFLLELIENAANALDGIRYEHTADEFASQESLCIKIVPDHSNHTLTVEDSGIGMTKHELVHTLGYSTASPAALEAFVEVISSGKSFPSWRPCLHGVGFYSAFLVSNKVRVVSKHDHDEQVVWEYATDQDGVFTIQKDTEMKHGHMKRGTKVICFLKESQFAILEEHRLKDLLIRPRRFIHYPIHWLPPLSPIPHWQEEVQRKRALRLHLLQPKKRPKKSIAVIGTSSL